MSPRPQFSQDEREILRAVSALHASGDVVEVRILEERNGRKSARSGYFNNFTMLTEAAVSYSGRPGVVGVYITLNPVNPDLLIRSPNCVDGIPNATADPDILRRTRFLIDIDPTRPSGISATDEEKARAEAVAQDVIDHLAYRGWPLPLWADSGNGSHCVYAVDLPNDAAARDLLRSCLAALAARFNTDAVKIDPGVYNSGRISRLYGTVAAKGDSTPDRPHRRSCLLDVPEPLEVVGRELLEALASEAPKQNAKPATSTAPRTRPELEGRAQWIEQFLAAAGIAHRGRQEYEDGFKWVLYHCFFDHAHDGTRAAVILLSIGAFVYRCLHAPDCDQSDWQKFRDGVEKKLGRSFLVFALYRLSEVLEANSVLVCQSVADCDAAKRLKLKSAATCCMDGEWREEHSETLRRKQRIIVIASAGDEDRTRAQKIAQSFRNYDRSLNVESLKVIELPNAGSLAEWAEGRSKSDLIGLCESTPEWKPDVAQAEAPPEGDESKAKPGGACGFALQSIGEIFAEPDLPTDYLVEDLLVAGTTSCTAAKPKAGKSTLARNLSHAVAHGERFLGMQTKQGEVIYLALEERKQDVKNDFRAMGSKDGDPLFVHAAPMPQDGVLALVNLIRQRKPALVVGDPLFRMVQVKDESAYAEMYNALGVIIDVCRETNTHIHVAHHGGKSEKADAIDTPLGSTAIAGAVATVIVLKRRQDDTRTIRTIARIGKDIPETFLQMDPVTKLLDLGAEKSVAEVETLAEQILDFLQTADEPKSRPEIEDGVEGKTGPKRKALARLVDAGKVLREGAGRRGDPFLFSCSHYIRGTREQETQKGPEPRKNTGDILVPDSSKNSFLVPGDISVPSGPVSTPSEATGPGALGDAESDGRGPEAAPEPQKELEIVAKPQWDLSPEEERALLDQLATAGQWAPRASGTPIGLAPEPDETAWEAQIDGDPDGWEEL